MVVVRISGLSEHDAQRLAQVGVTVKRIYPELEVIVSANSNLPCWVHTGKTTEEVTQQILEAPNQHKQVMASMERARAEQTIRQNGWE